MHIESFSILLLSLTAYTAFISVAFAGLFALRFPIRAVVFGGSTSPIRRVFPYQIFSNPLGPMLWRAEMPLAFCRSYSPGLAPYLNSTDSTFGFYGWCSKVGIVFTFKACFAKFIIALSRAKVVVIALKFATMALDFLSTLRAWYFDKIATICKARVSFANIVFAFVLIVAFGIAKMIFGIFNPIRMPEQYLAAICTGNLYFLILVLIPAFDATIISFVVAESPRIFFGFSSAVIAIYGLHFEVPNQKPAGLCLPNFLSQSSTIHKPAGLWRQMSIKRQIAKLCDASIIPGKAI